MNICWFRCTYGDPLDRRDCYFGVSTTATGSGIEMPWKHIRPPTESSSPRRRRASQVFMESGLNLTNDERRELQHTENQGIADAVRRRRPHGVPQGPPRAAEPPERTVVIRHAAAVLTYMLGPCRSAQQSPEHHSQMVVKVRDVQPDVD
eukprot:gene10997-biopygen1100